MNFPILEKPVGFTGQGTYGNVIHNGLQLKCSVSRNKVFFTFQVIPKIKHRWYRKQEYQICVSINIDNNDEDQTPIKSIYRFLQYNKFYNIDETCSFYNCEEDMKKCIDEMCKEIWNDPIVREF